MPLTSEKHYLFVLVALAATSSWWAGCDIEAYDTLTIASIVTFGAITSGFVGASLSILTSLNAPVMQRIRKTRYLVTLKRY